MAGLGLEISGDLKTALRFEQFPEIARERIVTVLQSIELRMLAAVLALEPKKTGQLQALTGGRVYDDPKKVAARVAVRTQDGNQARKASALEYGSHTSISVKVNEASLDRMRTRATKKPKIPVLEYRRTTNVTALHFLRDGIGSIRDGAVEELRIAIAQATQDFNA